MRRGLKGRKDEDGRRIHRVGQNVSRDYQWEWLSGFDTSVLGHHPSKTSYPHGPSHMGSITSEGRRSVSGSLGVGVSSFVHREAFPLGPFRSFGQVKSLERGGLSTNFFVGGPSHPSEMVGSGAHCAFPLPSDLGCAVAVRLSVLPCGCLLKSGFSSRLTLCFALRSSPNRLAATIAAPPSSRRKVSLEPRRYLPLWCFRFSVWGSLGSSQLIPSSLLIVSSLPSVPQGGCTRSSTQ